MEALLSELERLLYGYDYCVFLRAYRIPFVPGKPAEWYVSQALGPAAVIGGLVRVTGPEIIADVERSLRYTGDGSSGPKPSVLQSPQFEELVAQLGRIGAGRGQSRVIGRVLVAGGSPGVSCVLGLCVRDRGSSQRAGVDRQQFGLRTAEAEQFASETEQLRWCEL